MQLVFDPADPAVRANPHPILARLRNEDPVHRSPLLRSWILTRYDDVKRALGTDDMSFDGLSSSAILSSFSRRSSCEMTPGRDSTLERMNVGR
jgi:cytochrome P450